MKEFLSQRGVEFSERNVAEDAAAAAEMVQISQQRGVPVTVIDGQAVVGFDWPRLERLLAQAQKPRLGASVADAERVQGAVPGVRGAYIGRVRAGGLAEQAGLQSGDVITAIGSHAVHSADELASIVTRIAPGQTVRITYTRSGNIYESSIRI